MSIVKRIILKNLVDFSFSSVFVIKKRHILHRILNQMPWNRQWIEPKLVLCKKLIFERWDILFCDCCCCCWMYKKPMTSHQSRSSENGWWLLLHIKLWTTWNGFDISNFRNRIMDDDMCEWGEFNRLTISVKRATLAAKLTQTHSFNIWTKHW